MKIYRRAEFLKLPGGTFYNKLDAYKNSEDLCMIVKYGFDSANDWYYQSFKEVDASQPDIRDRIIEKMLVDNISAPLEEAISRDGFFDDKETFLVWEKEDMIVLRDLLNKSIEGE